MKQTKLNQLKMPKSVLTRGLMLATLSAGLSACFLFPEPVATEPGVSSVDPAPGATNVALSSNVRATLNLPDDGALDVTTLSDTAVTLTDASGVVVPAQRTLEGNTIVLDPDADLVIDTSYTFKVTNAVETADSVPLQPFSSSFSTGDAPPPPPVGTGLSASPATIVFTAGSPTGSDTRTLTLTNDSAETLDVSGLSVTGEDAAQFALADSSTFSLASGESRELSLTFNSSGVGPQLAALSVQSSAFSLEVPLGGLGVEGQGGSKEPSLQWILDTYGLNVSTGDVDPSTFNLIDSPTNGFVGAEVAGQTFAKADPAQPVTAQVLAAFGVENDPVLDFGFYTATQQDAKTSLFNIQQTPTLNAQRLAPEVTATGGAVDGDTVTFDPGTVGFGLYSFWPTNRFFSERTVYTEDKLNTFTDALPHQVRTYPLPGETNAYIVATEEFTSGFDYNDIVVILRNVVPAEGEVIDTPTEPDVPSNSGIPGLNVSNALGLPYDDRLVLERIGNVLPDPCDFDAEPDCDPSDNPYEGIAFPTTGTVDLENTGSSALQLSLSIVNDNLFVFPNGESTITVDPGETYPLDVEFNPSGSVKKGVYPAGLVVESGGQTAGIQLVGTFQTKPGGSREISLVSLSRDLFGYTTNIGTKTRLPGPELNTPLVGDEVRSDTWEAADPGSPVTALQLAAFHDCCKLSYPFELREPGGDSAFATMKPLEAYGQSIYPREEGGGLTELSANTTGPFEVFSAGYSSNPDNKRNKDRLGVRFWPLKERDGNVIPNTYIVGQDFVITGCSGTTPTPEDPDAPEDPDSPDGDDLATGDALSPAQSAILANCDYNDNVYIIRNVQPVN